MSLCPSCAAINFEKFFDIPRKPGSQDICKLDYARRQASTCEFCAFLVRSYELAFNLAQDRTHKKNANPTLSFRVLADKRYPDTDFEEPWYEQMGMWAWEVPPTGPCAWLQFQSTADAAEELADPLICVSLTTTIKSHSEDQMLVPRVRSAEEKKGRRLNYASMKCWISTCLENHTGLCRSPTTFKRLLLQTRVIDVDRREVVPIEPDVHYIALSYVWGPKIGHDALSFWRAAALPVKSMPLPDKLPATIEDAIQFCKNLGHKYLWVDAYCINQADEDELSRQIAIMDLVFECAFLTIAAVDSVNANAGLSGVSKPLQQLQQPEVEVPGLGLFRSTFVHDIWLHQVSSPWSERAWVLQELILSTRVVFLHKEYTAMRCHGGMFNSLIDHDYYSAGYKVNFEQSDMYFWENGFDVNLHRSPFLFTVYDAFVANYTRRALTNEEDRLDACSGAFNQITRSTGTFFRFGLPNISIHLALLWKSHHGQLLRRCQHFPSWTWAGWTGRSEYHYCLADLSEYDNEGPDQKVLYRRKGRLRRHPELYNGLVEKSAYIIDQELGSMDLKMSTQIANVTSQRVRRRGTAIKNLLADSEQPKKAVGDHWVVLSKSGERLVNDVGEVARFESIDYSFQLDQLTSRALEANDRRCALVFVRYFPHLRDTTQKGTDQWLFDYVGCLVTMPEEDSKFSPAAKRIGFVFLRLEDWLLLDRESKLVVIR